MINTAPRRLRMGLLSLTLFMSACSGSAETAPTAAPTTDPAQESSVEADASNVDDGITRFDGHPEGFPLTAGFIPELADLPVPGETAFHPGGAYDASQDPRETAVQRVDFLLEPSEVAAFYFEQMEAQGYVVATSSMPTSAAEIAEYTENGIESFTLVLDGPDGIPLQLTIGPSNTGGNSTMNINRFRSGTR